MKPRFLILAGLLWLGAATQAAAQIPLGPQRPGAPAAAPTAILGTVSDSAGRTLFGAAVTIRSGNDSSIVTGTLTDKNGKFRIEGLAAGSYHVHFSYIGYKLQERNVTLSTAAPTANLGSVRLATDVIALEGLTAEGVRSAVTVGVDRNIYTTKNMPAASGGNTTDLLRNVPELDVDIDGNVKLQGSQSVALHINGRPSPMRGEALKNFLQMLPANRVDRVEIVPNPSAKYDPEGIAGIVNIVLKDNLDLGFSGSFGITTDSRGRHGTNASLNYQKGNLTLFGNTSLNLNSNTMHLKDLRENRLATPTTFFSNDMNNEMSGRFIFFDGSAEYKLSKLSTLYASVRVMDANNNMDGLQINKILDAAMNTMFWYDWNNENEFNFANNDASIGLRRIVKPQQQEQTLEVRFTPNSQQQEQDYLKEFLTPSGSPTALLPENGYTNTATDIAELSIKADVTHPLTPKLKLDAGYKGALKGTDYENVLQRFTGDATTPFSTQRSDYNYDENYQQAYATLARSFGKLGVQIGARGEIANTTFELPTGDSYDNEYNNVFPSLNLSFSQSQALTMRLAYSKRLDRPQPNMLNPGQPSADSLNRFSGNPQLEPKYTHSYTFDVTRTGSWGMLKLSPYYRLTTNNWDFFKEVDARGVSTLSWQNTKSVKAYGTNATVSVRAGTSANGFLSFNAYQFKRDASNLNTSYSGDGFRWDLSANGMATVREGLMVQAFARYQAPQDMPQGKISSSVFSNIGLRQQLMNKKASLNVAVLDPFDVFKFKFETKDATHVQKSENNISIRSLRIAFSYNFGKPPTPTVRRQPDEQQQPAEQPQIR